MKTDLFSQWMTKNAQKRGVAVEKESKKRSSKRFELPMLRWLNMEQKGLRYRWMVNSMTAVLLVVVVLVVVFAMLFSNYCYSGMRSGLESRAKSASDFFSSYATDERSYLSMANYYITDFDDRDKLELQFINPRGQIILSSYSLTAGGSPGTNDIYSAIANQNVSFWVGKDPDTSERIMAVSSPIIHDGQVRGIMRLVTSLSVVDGQIILMVSLALLIATAVVAMVYFVNMYFIRSIVEPISRITDTAGAIAGGSYGIQIEKHYDDEIGDLIDSINNMSSKISQTEKMKSEFISSISHELRTPLTAINGWSETLLAGEFAEDRESTQKGLSIIASEGKRLSKMVEELLEFSRIEDGRFTLNIELVDIQAEFEDAIFTYRQFYKKKGIELEYKDKAGVLDPIPGDPERLRQVFSNVLDNAAKHGGEKQLIQASLGVEGDMVVIQIRDHGPGVQEKDLPHVKEMFYKASSKVRGNGIGLAVCDEIISRHGGTLTIANAKGGGCAVTIRLPMESPTAV
jgi:signal transduction histidine kinase